MAKRKRRPGNKPSEFGRGSMPEGLAIFAALEIIGALLLFLGAAAFGILGVLGIGNVIGAVAGFGSSLLIIIGIVLVIGAYGFIKGERWGWWLGLVIACVGIISIAVLDIFGFVIGIIMFYYLTRKRVKKWFRIN